MIAYRRQAVLFLVVLLVSASWFAHRVLSQGGALVGYGVLTPTGGSPVVAASALFSFRNAQGLLLSEAGIEAVEPISRGRIFVDREAPGSDTGMALANPSQESVVYRLTLRDGQGMESGISDQELGAGHHTSLFVSQLFPDRAGPGFVGSLTFETEDGGELAAVTVRQTLLAGGDVVFATLPVANLEAPPGPAGGGGQTIVFPHLGAGGPLTSQVILIAGPGGAASGQIEFFVFDPATGDPRPGGLRLDGAEGSSFPFQMAADGTFRATLTSTGDVVQGYAVITVDSGVVAAGTAVFQFRDGTGKLTSEAGVGAVPATTRARILVDTAGTQTGVAIASPGEAAEVTFELLDRNGESLDAVTRDLEAGDHLAAFVSQLFAGLPAGFLGVVEIRSDEPVVPITLKLTTENSRGLILTTLPIADLTRVRQGVVLVIPQVGWAPGAISLTTRLILINASSATAATGSLRFAQSSGLGLIPPGETADQIDYQIAAGGIGDLQEGQVSLSRIDLNLGDPSLAEVVVNEGNQRLLDPKGRDTLGRVRADVEVGFSNLDNGVAQVSPSGVISGMAPGFSTLTLSGGGIERKVTITVQMVQSSPSVGFTDVQGVAQDQAGRVYLAVGGEHTVVRFESLLEVPQLFAGVENTPGLVNAARLTSQFRGPSFLSLDKNRGRLFISDASNHVIRVVDPGDPGSVETFAGTGQPGADNGPRELATLNNPQGLDRGGGYLWIADAGNHTIRRIDLRSGQLETVAGQAGSVGNVDATGADARFNSPTGVAIDLRKPLSLIVADTGNGVLRRVFEDGRVITVGSGTSPNGTRSPAGGAQPAGVSFDNPTSVAVDPFGNIFVSEPDNDRVRTLLANGSIVDAAQEGTFAQPAGMAITETGRLIVAQENGRSRQVIYGGPTITHISPDLVSVQTSSTVRVVGSNFSPDSFLVVAGVVIEDFRVIDTATIEFETPLALPSGLNFLSVQNRGGLAQAPLLVRPLALHQLPEGHITTVAGGSAFQGEGSDARNVTLARPRAVALDAQGNLYIADQDNNRVRRVDAVTGIATTVAGTGVPTSSGDGGPATAAQVLGPGALALDAAGNLYIADVRSNLQAAVNSTAVIRRVDVATGIIEQVAGNGCNPFIPDFQLCKLADGPALEATLGDIGGMVVDGTNLYFSQSLDHGIQVVRKLDLAAGNVTTVAGKLFTIAGTGNNSVNPLQPPTMVGCFEFRESILLNIGAPSPIAGNYLASPAEFGPPLDTLGITAEVVEIDDGAGAPADGCEPPVNGGALAGKIALLDGGPCSFVGQVKNAQEAGAVAALVANPANHIIVPMVGDDPSIAIPSAAIGFEDANLIRGELAGGLSITLKSKDCEVSDGVPAGKAVLTAPRGLAVDLAGSLFVADGPFVWKIASDDLATVLGDGGAQIASLRERPTTASFPVFDATGVAVEGDGDIYVADEFLDEIFKMDAASGAITTVAGGQNGAFGDGGPASEAALNAPFSLAVDSGGNLLIGDRLNHRVRRVDAMTGTIDTVAGTGQGADLGDGRPAFAATIKPDGVWISEQDDILLIEPEGNRIRRIDGRTGLISTFAGGCTDCELGDGGPATNARLVGPAGVVSNPAGDVFIMDSGQGRIRKVDASSGIITTVAGGGNPEDGYGDDGPALEAAIDDAQGLAIDGAGNLYTVDRRRIRKIATDGSIMTVAGSGCQVGSQICPRGDYGPATEATLTPSPFLRSSMLASDTRGNLYLAEEEFSRIRRVDVETGLITTVLGNGCDQFVANNCLLLDNVPATQMGLRPKGLGVDAGGNLWVSGKVSGADETLVVNALTGVVTRVAGGGFPADGVGDGGPAQDAFFLQAVAAAFDSEGNLYVPDVGQGRLRGVRGVVPSGPEPHRSIVFVDNMENGDAGWTTVGSTGSQSWSLTTEVSNNGAQSWFSSNLPDISDQRLTLKQPINLPANAISAILTLWHQYDLEETFDGGVVEISTDGGANWVDAGGMMLGNGYDAELDSGFGNPLGGRMAFTGEGPNFPLFTNVTVDLTSLRGTDVLIRFRLGTDSEVQEDGWFIDDVELAVTVP